MIRLRTVVLLLVAPTLTAQQVPDSAFTPPISSPTFGPGAGPVVLIDAAHHNFHTADGGFLPFANLLRRDGYRVAGNARPFDATSLDSVDLLVIANPLHRRNLGGNWVLPTPSAFSQAEIRAVRRWVEQGGALLLIADHMPFPGAAADLAAAFGVEMPNGFAMDTAGATGGVLSFRRADGTLANHPVTRGRGAAELIDSVVSFTGNAFRWPQADPLLVLGPGTAVFLPDTAWRFGPGTPRLAGAGMLQGAVRQVGLGRVAIFGEAAMFTAQLAGPNRIPVGMNAPGAPRNAQLVLNLMRWLAGRG